LLLTAFGEVWYIFVGRSEAAVKSVVKMDDVDRGREA